LFCFGRRFPLFPRPPDDCDTFFFSAFQQVPKILFANGPLCPSSKKVCSPPFNPSLRYNSLYDHRPGPYSALITFPFFPSSVSEVSLSPPTPPSMKSFFRRSQALLMSVNIRPGIRVFFQGPASAGAFSRSFSVTASCLQKSPCSPFSFGLFFLSFLTQKVSLSFLLRLRRQQPSSFLSTSSPSSREDLISPFPPRAPSRLACPERESDLPFLFFATRQHQISRLAAQLRMG